MRRLAPLAVALLSACRDDTVHDEAQTLRAVLVATPADVRVGDPVFLDAGDSEDQAGNSARYEGTNIASFAFDFGDGGAQNGPLFYAAHAWEEPGEYTVVVTIESDGETASGETSVLVRPRPPVLTELDVGADDKAVIGEWVRLLGRSFRADDVPAVTWAGVDSDVIFVSDWEIAVKVPTGIASGTCDVEVVFPGGEGGGSFEPWVARYALVTDAWNGAVRVVEMGEGASAWPHSQSLDLANVAIARVSGDGALALISDARFQATLQPTVRVVDMTANFGPAVVAEIEAAGVGPAWDIAWAGNIARAVVADAGGFTVFDLSVPAAPVAMWDRLEWTFDELAPSGVALNDDGTRLAVLSTWNDRLRVYDLTPTGPVDSEDWVSVGPATQDLYVHDGLVYVLGGGGDGAIPPDLDGGNTTLSVIDPWGFQAENVLGASTFPALPEAALPIDFAMGGSGTAYLTSFDDNLADLLGAFENIAGNPLSLSGWIDLVESIAGLSVGAVLPYGGAAAGAPLLGERLFVPWGFPTGIDVRFDERVFVSAVIGLGTTISFLENDELLHLSLDLDYGLAVGDLTTGQVTVHEMFSAPIVSYVDFVLDYDVQPLIDLLLPPWALGDAVIQP